MSHCLINGKRDLFTHNIQILFFFLPSVTSQEISLQKVNILKCIGNKTHSQAPVHITNSSSPETNKLNMKLD